MSDDGSPKLKLAPEVIDAIARRMIELLPLGMVAPGTRQRQEPGERTRQRGRHRRSRSEVMEQPLIREVAGRPDFYGPGATRRQEDETHG